MNVEIGMKYIKRGDKQKHIRTVIDCHKTYNLAGELVKTRYVASHNFCGQSLKEYDVVQPTICIGLIQ